MYFICSFVNPCFKGDFDLGLKLNILHSLILLSGIGRTFEKCKCLLVDSKGVCVGGWFGVYGGVGVWGCVYVCVGVGCGCVCVSVFFFFMAGLNQRKLLIPHTHK